MGPRSPRAAGPMALVAGGSPPPRGCGGGGGGGGGGGAPYRGRLSAPRERLQRGRRARRGSEPVLVRRQRGPERGRTSARGGEHVAHRGVPAVRRADRDRATARPRRPVPDRARRPAP